MTENYGSAKSGSGSTPSESSGSHYSSGSSSDSSGSPSEGSPSDSSGSPSEVSPSDSSGSPSDSSGSPSEGSGSGSGSDSCSFVIENITLNDPPFSGQFTVTNTGTVPLEIFTITHAGDPYATSALVPPILAPGESGTVFAGTVDTDMSFTTFELATDCGVASDIWPGDSGGSGSPSDSGSPGDSGGSGSGDSGGSGSGGGPCEEQTELCLQHTCPDGDTTTYIQLTGSLNAGVFSGGGWTVEWSLYEGVMQWNMSGPSGAATNSSTDRCNPTGGFVVFNFLTCNAALTWGTCPEGCPAPPPDVYDGGYHIENLTKGSTAEFTLPLQAIARPDCFIKHYRFFYWTEFQPDAFLITFQDSSNGTLVEIDTGAVNAGIDDVLTFPTYDNANGWGSVDINNVPSNATSCKVVVTSNPGPLSGWSDADFALWARYVAL